MSQQSITPEERFALLVEEFLGVPGITTPADEGASRRKFGAAALKIHDKIFAMLTRDRLVVKLPQSRVDALIASADGERFDPRHDGRLMKEWLALDPTSTLDWPTLAREAMTFVAARH